MRNDSADGPTVEAHSEAFSGGAYSRWACWTQADPDPSCVGSGTVDSAMAHAAAKLSELQNRASTLSNLCCNEILRLVLTDVANELRENGALDEEECFIDATFVMARWRVGNRTNEARKRHENHGDCGSPCVAALGQHARREPSRSPLGAAMLRLLHDRSQAGEFDRRSRLRQRSAG